MYESGTDASQGMDIYHCYKLLGKVIDDEKSNWELARQELEQELQNATIQLNEQREISQFDKTRIAELENMNAKLENKNKESIARFTELENRNQAIESHSQTQKSFYTRMEKELTQKLDDAQSEIGNIHGKANRLSGQVKSLEKERSQLVMERESSSEKIFHMTKDLLRLSNLNPEPTRDDHSLGSEFSNIFLAVQEWTLRYFDKDTISQLGSSRSQYMTAKDIDETLDPVLSNWPESTYFRKEPLLFLQAVVAHYVVEYIFDPFLFGWFKNEEMLLVHKNDKGKCPHAGRYLMVFSWLITSYRYQFNREGGESSGSATMAKFNSHDISQILEIPEGSER